MLSGVSAFAELENIVDGEDNTLLHVAAAEGHVFIIKQLIEGGVDVDVVDGKGLTPLYYAIKEEHMEIVRFLLRAGANVDVWGSNRAGQLPETWKDGKHCEPLLHAVMRDGTMRMFNLLMEEAVDLDLEMRDSKQCTALHIAALLGKVDIMKALLDKGADPCAEDFIVQQPIHLAASSSNPLGLVLLLDAGADVNLLAFAGMGPTPLENAMGALECGNVCLLKEVGGVIRDNGMISEKVQKLCNCLTPGKYMERYRDEL